MRARWALAGAVCLIGVGGCDSDVEQLPDLRVTQPSDLAAAMTLARFAHLAPDEGPVDFCLAASGSTSFVGGGPLLMQHGLGGGISYPNVSTYISLPSGVVDIRVIPGGTTCAAAPLLTMSAVNLGAGATQTEALIGQMVTGATHPLALASYADDTAALAAQALLRVVHAAPTVGPIDVAAVNGTTATPLFAALPYGKAGTGTGVDANGYLGVTPFTATTTLAVKVTGTTMSFSTPPATPPGLPAGGIRSAFVIGGNTDAPMQPLQILLCGDNLGPLTGNSSLSNCITSNLVASP